ncbi:hypothetical protein FRC03_008236 [Tulasnella sp. 419]|nr:hypothetical protein FRC03_008236 [Tulasnella sp. 419]
MQSPDCRPAVITQARRDTGIATPSPSSTLTPETLMQSEMDGIPSPAELHQIAFAFHKLHRRVRQQDGPSITTIEEARLQSPRILWDIMMHWQSDVDQYNDLFKTFESLTEAAARLHEKTKAYAAIRRENSTIQEAAQNVLDENNSLLQSVEKQSIVLHQYKRERDLLQTRVDQLEQDVADARNEARSVRIQASKLELDNSRVHARVQQVEEELLEKDFKRNNRAKKDTSKAKSTPSRYRLLTWKRREIRL